MEHKMCAEAAAHVRVWEWGVIDDGSCVGAKGRYVLFSLALPMHFNIPVVFAILCGQNF